MKNVSQKQDSGLGLTVFFKDYKQGILDKKELEGKIFQFFMNNYQQFRLYQWDKDDYMDFLGWVYPRLSRAIERYQDTGSSFDAYITSMVRWSAREYRFRETEHQIVEYSCWKARALEMEVHSEEPAYLQVEPEPVFQKMSNPRQILILLMKSYHHISDDFVRRAAPSIGMAKSKLTEILDELRKLRMERDNQIQDLRERLHSQFYRCRAFEKKLESAIEGTIRHEKLSYCLTRARMRLKGLRKKLASVKIEASNRQIALVLGIPKGTVDSNLYALKEKWKLV
jgi:hypothetical protein